MREQKITNIIIWNYKAVSCSKTTHLLITFFQKHCLPNNTTDANFKLARMVALLGQEWNYIQQWSNKLHLSLLIYTCKERHMYKEGRCPVLLCKSEGMVVHVVAYKPPCIIGSYDLILVPLLCQCQFKLINRESSLEEARNAIINYLYKESRIKNRAQQEWKWHLHNKSKYGTSDQTNPCLLYTSDAADE